MQSGADLPNSAFSSLPAEITLRILSHLNEQELGKLSRIDKHSLALSKSDYLHYKRILQLGVRRKYLALIAPHIDNFRSLYHAIELIPRKERFYLQPWALSCLSGESDAIEYAKVNFNLHNEISDNNLRTPLHFLCLATTTEKLINGMQLLNIKPKHLKAIDYKKRNMMHYCALSGNPQTLSYAMLLHFKLDEMDMHGADARHYAALSGSRRQIKFTLFTHHMDADKKDLFKNTSLQYALLSSNAFFATEQVERYQKKLLKRGSTSPASVSA